jgi:Sulfatase-modifying factor enzyme 1
MKLTLAIMPLIVLLLVNCAWCDTFGTGASMFDITFVSIGNPGNPGDTAGVPNPSGSVAYAYQIGKYEASEQMVDKANALGGLGITKDTRGPDKPVTSVTWLEAARFVNWLNTSTGNTPAYKFAIQPGEPGYSPNDDILLWSPSDVGYDPNNLYRNKLARYFLPSNNEWYKSAYYNPTGGNYFVYPTGSSSAPDGRDFAGDTVFDAVFSDGATAAEPNDITNVGKLSPFGTAGQGGNVWELTETDINLLNDTTITFNRIWRGGSWNSDISFLRRTSRISGGSLSFSEANYLGFRIASSVVPEPATTILVVIAFSMLIVRRRAANCL